MKTQKITPPIGYEIDKEKSTFDEIVFKLSDNEVNSWEDLKIKAWTFYFSAVPESFKENLDKYIKLQKLIDLMDHDNNGWQPNWEDIFEVKWCIHLISNEICISDWTECHRLIYFKSESTAKRFRKTHKELIESVKELL